MEALNTTPVCVLLTNSIQLTAVCAAADIKWSTRNVSVLLANTDPSGIILLCAAKLKPVLNFYVGRPSDSSPAEPLKSSRWTELWLYAQRFTRILPSNDTYYYFHIITAYSWYETHAPPPLFTTAILVIVLYVHCCTGTKLIHCLILLLLHLYFTLPTSPLPSSHLLALISKHISPPFPSSFISSPRLHTPHPPPLPLYHSIKKQKI